MTTQDLATQDQAQPQLTVSEIKRYICPNATDQEAYLFLRLCIAQQLNPFLREAYLVKYGTGPATMIVGKEGFTKRAEAHPMFDGFKAGVIVHDDNGLYHYPEASFSYAAKLIGGWAEVYRKDRRIAFRVEVALAEFDTGKNQWSKMPGTMIRKVALVSALREAFPTSFAGLYDAAEMAVDVDKETGEITDRRRSPAKPAAGPVVASDPYDAMAPAPETPVEAAPTPAPVSTTAQAPKPASASPAGPSKPQPAYPDGWKPADAQDLLRWALNNGYNGALLNKTLRMSLEAAVAKNGLLAVYGDLLAGKP